jgi:hypothetical protein
MAKNSITDYDNIAANNTDIQSVDIDEGCAPSGINNAIRELMADLADVNDGTVPLASPDINGGTIDGVTIGGTTAGAGTFTTGTFTSGASSAAVHSYTQLEIESASHSALQFSGSTGAEQWIWFADDSSNPPVGGITYYHGGPYMGFRVEGSERMRINSSGNVGIGTSSPITPLHIVAASPSLWLEGGATGQSNILLGPISDADEGSIFYDQTNNALGFRAGAAERLRIDSSGRVGIGTSSPSYAIDTLSSGAIVAQFKRDASGGGSGGIRFGNNDKQFTLYGDNSNGLTIYDGSTERMRIDSSGNVGIGTTSIAGKFNVGGGRSNFGANSEVYSIAVGYTQGRCNSGQTYYIGATDSATPDLVFSNAAGTERMRLDSSGNLLAAKTSTNTLGTVGHDFGVTGYAMHTRASSNVLYLNRTTNDGNIVEFYKDGTTIGSIGSFNGVSYYGGTAGGIMFNGTAINPTNGTAGRTDNINDIGALSFRYDDIYATNGTIQTSDANEKQQIASLTDAEMTAAKAISKLFKTFKWNDKVEAKGDAARRHAGVIAQDVQQAMTDAGLDAGDYAFFISATWWETQTEVPAVIADEENGIEAVDAYTRTDTYDTAEEAPEGATERTRLGVRYPELLSFIGAATEQRLANIESRLETLENK